MTPQVWAVKVAAVFILIGGAAGGAALGLMIALESIVNAPEYYLTAAVETLFRLPVLMLLTALVGVVVGFPAAALTAVAYVSGARTMRHRWRIAAFGIVTSALWGALFVDLISSNPISPINYLGMAAFFAFGGAVAAVTCLECLERWNLQWPT